MVAELLAGKDRFTALDTIAVARELRALGRAHVDKVFDLGPDRFGVTFRAPGVGKRILVLRPGQYAALVADMPERDEELSSLSKELRRVIGGSALGRVADPDGERFLELELSRGDADAPFVLGAELFAPGNLLVARGGKLLVVAHPKTWSKRSVRVGAPYSRPPARTNPWSLDGRGVETVLRASRTDRTSTLAARLGLGGPLAEEVLARTGADGGAPATAAAEEFAPLVRRALADLLEEVGDRPKGYLYSLEGTALDATPFESRRMGGRTGVSVEVLDTYSAAAHRYFDGRLERRSEEEDAVAGQLEEWRRQRGQQEKAVEELRTQVALLTRHADLLLAHFPEVERQVASAETEADGSVRVTVEEEAIPLTRGRSIRSSAQTLYDEAKRIQSKLAGASAALSESDGRLARSATELLSRAPRARSVEAAKRRTPNWYERYRWFHTTEGLLVIGGRDAPTNDLIVRRYLKPGDKYVHADIHGAPSVIVKHPAPGDPSGTEASVAEAAQWGVAFSKAWRAGLASASAFAVEADQVSKAAASGEFVPRGAWVIHGTKEVLKDLPLELGLGTVEDKGETLWNVAPPRSLERRGKLVYVLSPGPERERAEREVELAGDAGVPRDRLQSLLPA
ncbi:MAG TPA: ribosome rescue protein RqcH, partial [Thermoplasmata archaeon]|nr:ribosome rescue protein RqcH [Thermoplasmata archaeon]